MMFTLHEVDLLFEKNGVGRHVASMCEVTNAYIFVGKLEGNNQLGRPRST
jgi:hypothetical protein